MKQHTKLTPATILVLTWLCLSTQVTVSSQASSSSLGTSSALVTASEAETKKRAAAKHLVVFGLTEILLGHSVPKITCQLGWRILASAWDLELPNRMRTKRAEVLDAVLAEKAPFTAAGDDQGRPMSRIIFEQQAGTKDLNQTMEEINGTIKKLASQQGFFSSDREKILVTNLINAIDNPKMYINCMSPLEEGLELAQLCSQNPDNELMILSNFGRGLFKTLTTLYPEVFKYFKPKNILIVGDISEADRKRYFSTRLHVIKPGGPEGEIFRYVEARTGYAAEQITFIDHTAIDAEVAKNARGWQSLQVKKGDFGPVKQALIKQGVILLSDKTTRANTGHTAASTSSVAVNTARATVSSSNTSTTQIQEVPKVEVLAVQAS